VLIAGLCLRLFFVLKFPAIPATQFFYEQIATNWLKHHVYGMDVGGLSRPSICAMPGYPAVSCLMYALTGRTGAHARLWVMVAQIAWIFFPGLVTARLAALLLAPPKTPRRTSACIPSPLWLAVLCPFTANYAAVPLTEVFAVLWTGLACNFLVLALRRAQGRIFC